MLWGITFVSIVAMAHLKNFSYTEKSPLSNLKLKVSLLRLAWAITNGHCLVTQGALSLLHESVTAKHYAVNFVMTTKNAPAILKITDRDKLKPHWKLRQVYCLARYHPCHSDHAWQQTSPALRLRYTTKYMYCLINKKWNSSQNFFLVECGKLEQRSLSCVAIT